MWAQSTRVRRDRAGPADPPPPALHHLQEGATRAQARCHRMAPRHPAQPRLQAPTGALSAPPVGAVPRTRVMWKGSGGGDTWGRGGGASLPATEKERRALLQLLVGRKGRGPVGGPGNVRGSIERGPRLKTPPSSLCGPSSTLTAPSRAWVPGAPNAEVHPPGGPHARTSSRL